MRWLLSLMSLNRYTAGRKRKPCQQPKHHDNFAIPKIEMDYGTHVERYERAQCAQRDPLKIPFLFNLQTLREPPYLYSKNRHHRIIEHECGQSPPCRYLKRGRMKVAG